MSSGASNAGKQNTPAQFHGRPELSEALTDKLQQMLEEVQTHGSKTSS